MTNSNISIETAQTSFMQLHFSGKIYEDFYIAVIIFLEQFTSILRMIINYEYLQKEKRIISTL